MLFKFTDLSVFGQSILGIFNVVKWFTVGFSDAVTESLFKNNVFFIIVSVLACTPIVPAISALLDKTKFTKAIKTAVGVVIPAILLILSSFALAGDSYNPFLYFQF
jgi:alginate O-acetyltransferase complex protein AlgI